MNAAGHGCDRRRRIAKRNLIKIKRVPDLIVFALLSPIMFVLLFAYIFGSAIEIPGSYREFLIAGHLHPDGDLRRDLDRPRAGRGHAEGHHRPVPLAADGSVGGAGRAHHQRRRDQRRSA